MEILEFLILAECFLSVLNTMCHTACNCIECYDSSLYLSELVFKIDAAFMPVLHCIIIGFRSQPLSFKSKGTITLIQTLTSLSQTDVNFIFNHRIELSEEYFDMIRSIVEFLCSS